MTDYFIRTTDKEKLLSLGVQIGLLAVAKDGKYHLADPTIGIWDEVGQLLKETGNIISTEVGDFPETVPSCAPEGDEYWHANLRLHTQSLGGIARAAYDADPTPELAAALASLPAYFVVDAEGMSTAPAQPLRIFG